MTKSRIITAGFLGLACLFGVSEANAEHKPLTLRAGQGGARISFNLGGGGLSIHTGHGHVEAGRRWVPAHYEERHVQVLVHKGHFVERNVQVLVHKGHFDTRYVPPVYRTVVHRDGCRENVLVRAGYTERVWMPDRYETRCEKVWVPDRYETRSEKVLVPGHFEPVRVTDGHDHGHDHGHAHGHHHDHKH